MNPLKFQEEGNEKASVKKNHFTPEVMVIPKLPRWPIHVRRRPANQEAFSSAFCGPTIIYGLSNHLPEPLRSGVETTLHWLGGLSISDLAHDDSARTED